MNKQKSEFAVLRVGDIRQKGDEVQRSHIPEATRAMIEQARKENYELDPKFQKPQSYFYGFRWEKTHLIGLPILPADAMHLEHRRPT